jgi:hypothetical protein
MVRRTGKLIVFLFLIDHHAHDHTHDPGVSSVSIVCEGEMDLEKVGSKFICHALFSHHR